MAGASMPGLDILVSDGTTAGTVMLKDLGGAIWPTESGGVVYFSGEGTQADDELWVSDGTPEGTRLVKDINPGPNPSDPFELTDVNGTLYFTAFAAGFGREIWKSDGTEEGTVMVVDLNPGSGSGGAYELTNVDGTLFFGRFDSAQGWQLWKSDGTAAGTTLVKVIGPPTVPSDRRPDYLVAANGRLFFRADDGVHGLELWVSNGFDWGTFMVADISPGPGHHAPGNFMLVGNILFYAAGGDGSGQELWAFDTTDPVIPTTQPIGLVGLGALVLFVGVFVLRKGVRSAAQPQA